MNLRILFIAFTVGLLVNGGASAQQKSHSPEFPVAAPQTPKTSYEARQLKRRGVHEMDPNIYAYSADFARRFQMPEAWIVSDLNGAEAIAFRMLPTYKTCGWVGDPNSCRDDEMACFLDIYFDHLKQPLPWDSRMPSREAFSSRDSSGFISSFANPIYRLNRQFVDSSTPFTDPESGKALAWRRSTSSEHGRGGGAIAFLSGYDKEIFKTMSMLAFHVACDGAAIPEYMWLSNDRYNLEDRPAAHHFVHLSNEWRQRVRAAQEVYDERTSAFFKQEGSKALGALQNRLSNELN